jgi:hypothetical protein
LHTFQGFSCFEDYSAVAVKQPYEHLSVIGRINRIASQGRPQGIFEPARSGRITQNFLCAWQILFIFR